MVDHPVQNLTRPLINPRHLPYGVVLVDYFVFREVKLFLDGFNRR